MKIIFMGTPEFACDTLITLINSENHEVLGVFTQPDRAKGRSKKLLQSPVKKIAEENEINVYQPEKLRKLDNFDDIKKLNPDVIIVAAYGQILPKEIIEYPKYGCINVHASILPKYRGAAPINYCIIEKDKYAGVTIMQMDEGLDTGNIIKISQIEMDKDETDVTLTKKLSILGAETLLEVLDEIERTGKIVSKAQDNENSTYVPMMKKELGYIDFNNSSSDIEALIRGITIWPTATCLLNGKRVKIYRAEYNLEDINGNIGEVVYIDKKSLGIKCGEGTLYITELQVEGKKRMSVSDFLRGQNIKLGDRFEKIS